MRPLHVGFRHYYSLSTLRRNRKRTAVIVARLSLVAGMLIAPAHVESAVLGGPQLALLGLAPSAWPQTADKTADSATVNARRRPRRGCARATTCGCRQG